MRRLLPLLIVLGVAVGGAITFLAFSQPRLDGTDVAVLLPADFTPDPAKGKVLYHMGGCGSCHKDENGNLGGGAALETPFGAFYPGNISPDPMYGIGGWSDAEFVTAVTRGIAPDGSHYYPAFPFTAYSRVKVDDLLHLRAYLNTTIPVAQAAKPNDLAFPFNLRLGNAYWSLLFADLAAFSPDPTQSDEWNRGAYIANGLGHCSVCHTPRNLVMAERKSQLFFGAPALKAGQKAAPRLAGIAPDKILNGLDEWAGAVSEQSAMYHVTQSYSNHVPLSDHEALALYFSSLPAPK
jgi:mono/diheme cytochrome c family protein